MEPQVVAPAFSLISQRSSNLSNRWRWRKHQMFFNGFIKRARKNQSIYNKLENWKLWMNSKTVPSSLYCKAWLRRFKNLINTRRLLKITILHSPKLEKTFSTILLNKVWNQLVSKNLKKWKISKNCNNAHSSLKYAREINLVNN